MYGCVRDELKAMKEGLNDVIPPELLSGLTAEVRVISSFWPCNQIFYKSDCKLRISLSMNFVHFVLFIAVYVVLLSLSFEHSGLSSFALLTSDVSLFLTLKPRISILFSSSYTSVLPSARSQLPIRSFFYVRTSHDVNHFSFPTISSQIQDFQLLLSGGSASISLSRLKSVIRFNHTHGSSPTVCDRFEKLGNTLFDPCYFINPRCGCAARVTVLD